MGIDDLLALIANTGFPIAVASYLIFRMEEKLDRLNETLSDLATIIKQNAE